LKEVILKLLYPDILHFEANYVVPKPGVNLPSVQYATLQNRGILLPVCADMGVCPKTAHLVHRSTVIYTLNITIFIFLIHMHRYSI